MLAFAEWVFRDPRSRSLMPRVPLLGGLVGSVRADPVAWRLVATSGLPALRDHSGPDHTSNVTGRAELAELPGTREKVILTSRYAGYGLQSFTEEALRQ